MKQFSYISRNYVPSVDLNTLGRTFDTLEQGHKEAIQSASQLKATIANLPLDPSENGWRQQYIDKIDQTVRDNTLFGNSYGALDNLIAEAGDIASDAGMIGRLQANQAHKEYEARVDAMNIPEGYKQMYKEENPYYYKDGSVDKKTGKVTAGTVWKANSSPVNSIDAFALRAKALSIVRADAGGGESVSFLDAAGRPTSDPSKSEDGTIYKKTGTKWERLSDDKILKAVNQAIAETPGAMDSLQQDYRYALWRRNKDIQEAKKLDPKANTSPVIPGLTDKYGNVIDFNTWLLKQNNEFADAAAYTHTYTSVDYGPALANRRERQNKAAAAAASLQQQITNGTDGLGQQDSGHIDVDSNKFVNAMDAKRQANGQGLAITKKYMARSFGRADSISDVIGILRKKYPNEVKGPQTAAAWIIKNHGRGMSAAEKSQLINSFVGYQRANQQYYNMYNAAKKAGDVDAIKFADDYTRGVYTNSNKYSRDIQSQLNELANGTADYSIGANVYNSMKGYLDSKGLVATQDSDGNYHIVFNSRNRNLLPEFASKLKAADDANSKWSPWNWIKDRAGFTTDDSYTVKFTNNGVLAHANNNGWLGGLTDMGNLNVGKTWNTVMANTYNRGVRKSNDIQAKIGVTRGTKAFLVSDAGSAGAAAVRQQGLEEGWKDTEIQAAEDVQNKRLMSMIAAGNLASGQLYTADANGHYTKSVENNQEVGQLLQWAAANGALHSNLALTDVSAKNDGTSYRNGYVFTVSVPADEKGKGGIASKYAGKQIKVFAAGTTIEGTNYSVYANPALMANNAIQTAKATNSDVENMGYDNYLGDTRVINKRNGTFGISFLGRNKNVDEETAKNYSAYLQRLDAMKANYLAGNYSNQQLRANSAMQLGAELGALTGVGTQEATNAIINYINHQ